MPPDAVLPRRALALLYATAALAAWWVGPRGPVYWDSFGYVIQSITGRVGGLMLGRPTFVLVSHAAVSAWRALGGGVASVEPLLRALWMLVSALGAPALALVALRAGASTRSSLAAGLLLALSPSVAHTSRAVLTDAPSMAVTVMSFAVALRAARDASTSRMALAGALLGVAGGLREQAVAHLLTLAALAWTAPRRRAALVAVAVVGCALSLALPVAWIALRQPSYVSTLREWGRAMAGERAQHPYGARDFAMFLAWLAASGPSAVWLSIASVTRRRGAIVWSSRLLALAIPSGLQLAALAFYQDISFSPRYLLAALPCAVMLPAGLALDVAGSRRSARRGVAIATVATALVAGVVMRVVERPLVEGLRTLPARLAAVPSNAAVVTGQLCPAVVYLREFSKLQGDARPAWVQVCPGWRWPRDLGARLDALRAEGRPVVIDLRADSWVGDRQRRCRDEAARYARSHVGQVTLWR